MISIKNIHMAIYNYTIAMQLQASKETIVVAGFNAHEEVEAAIGRHLLNLCKQGDGKFMLTQSLLQKALEQWQDYFNISAMQVLHNASYVQEQNINAVQFCKTKELDKEQLISRYALG
jgi:4-hydroxy-3-methylbut-2-enyl diphosphate reductase IspH